MHGLSKELEIHAAIVADMTNTVDRGLNLLNTTIRAMSTITSRPVADEVAEKLRLTYEDNIAQPVIDDRFTEAASSKPQLDYPHKDEAFIPQAFKVILQKNINQHLEDEGLWASCESRNDLGPFVMRYLESAYGTDALLLVLGHPGSGKSLLTEMLAARLMPGLSVIRVELRDIDAEADLQSQLEEQIRRDTGHDIGWIQFVGDRSAEPPLVILDGFDELLQASGKTFSHYLLDVAKFQRRERVLGRPVRIMVTSRITLIDKAAVPRGTTVLRLLEFDESRRSLWVERWNAHNERYFTQSQVDPFTIPGDPKVLQLAEQPLLLLMLAVYDSAANQLSKNPNLDQTLLYYSLLVRFIERERHKGKSGLDFLSRPQPERDKVIEEDLERLGIAAISMFNRQTLHIQREELDADISYFKLTREVPAETGRRLSQADLLLGSFFFIHESKSSSSDPEIAVTGQPTAFEFLHNTFGEFLAADFILRRVARQTDSIGKLCADPSFISVLEQRLELLEEDWFACLIYTPLYTRPVILGMLREWFSHKVKDVSRPRQTVLSELDMVIYRQLKNILFGIPPKPIMERRIDSPYGTLPLLGHLAVYSLNLILLRTVLSDNYFTFDELTFNADNEGCRPWDRLVQLWRSWLPLDSLTGVGAIMNASRSGNEVIVHSESFSSTKSVSQSRLHAIFNVADALGDDVLSVLSGLSVYDGSNIEGSVIGESVSRLSQDDIDLTAQWSALKARWESESPQITSRYMNQYLNRHISEPFGPTLLEVFSRYGFSLKHAPALRVSPTPASGLAKLSRYEAELWIELKDHLEPRWLPYLLSDMGPATDMLGLLTHSWAGAPLLWAASRRFMNSNVIECTMRLNTEGPLGHIVGAGFIDLETAASMANLAAIYDASDLCEVALRAIIDGITNRRWHLGDISEKYLRCLADAIDCGVVGPATVSEVRSVVTYDFDHEFRQLLRSNSRNVDLSLRVVSLLVEIARITEAPEAISDVVEWVKMTSDELSVDAKTLTLIARVARELPVPGFADAPWSLSRFMDRNSRRPTAMLHSVLTSQDLDNLRWVATQWPQSELGKAARLMLGEVSSPTPKKRRSPRKGQASGPPSPS